MMKKTDKHFRFLCRNLSKKSYLYTEMIHCNAILKGDSHKLLSYGECEHPIALQLGGSNPKDLGEAAKIASEYNYDEINLNVGCPSKKVKSGNFGVFLMKDLPLLQKCLSEIKNNSSVPVTVKCRIGVDELEGNVFLDNFIRRLKDTGIKTFIVHARKAISGLDTKRNRSIPPLLYKEVYNIKQNHSDTEIILNGGITSHDEINHHIAYVDGVMLDNRKDANRAINHLMQFIKSLTIEKNKRKALLEELNNKNVELSNVFENFTRDRQKNLSLNL